MQTCLFRGSFWSWWKIGQKMWGLAEWSFPFLSKGKKGSETNEERGNWKHSRGLFLIFFLCFFSFQLGGTSFGVFLEIENRRVKKCRVCFFFLFSPKMDMASKFVCEIEASIFLFTANNEEFISMLHKLSVFPSSERVQT